MTLMRIVRVGLDSTIPSWRSHVAVPGRDRCSFVLPLEQRASVWVRVGVITFAVGF